LFSLFTTGESFSATYHASPSGSGTTCSSASPCTVSYAINTKAVAGDTVLLKNGTYTGPSGMVNVGKSGTSGKPITIKAENDGQAIVNGEYARKPFYMKGRSYINVEGIIFKRSNYEVIMAEQSNHITFKRVSGYDGNPAINAGSVFVISSSSNVLLEDCAASGNGKHLFAVSTSHYVTVRRCWGMWRHSNIEPNTVFTVYGSDNTIVENCVATFNSTDSNGVKGFHVWAHYYNNSADYNTIIGNVAYNFSNAYSYYIASSQHNITGNQFINNVSIDASGGFYQRGGENTIADHMTLVGNAVKAVTQDQMPYHPKYPTDCDFRDDLALQNSILGSISTITWKKDALQLAPGSPPAYPTHSTTNNVTRGTFNTATYGKGAYLIRPTDTNGAGAEVLYRYVDGVLHDGKDGRPGPENLWPWRMEARIKAETGYSVTWESKGGLWKTLDGVYNK
jgi:hypothetical protein